ncbi:hypothetical protein FHX82_005577 [Amycolatopsis bartoniae]|uniref:Cytochrome P450 n=1 Tax=Amycolatopsis bartoniae TaxID=941986 RepID=A0A8H9ME97_9PSEU|nr:cytochrome P450 [Amycolatopsis bartoniae]MBB2938499.1 hypothetical protein [Amycolatopsis bartoniae]TVT10355.1 cytochrome P450 [Amycolatopsis bartoniae]GHF70571.1 cytochrome P450 [Amycolatopsis bartoniae]
MTEQPRYPMRRRCPFDPPPELARLQAAEPVSRVRLWDGSTPWLVTRYDDVREMLRDPRVSADTDRPGYPFPTPSMAASRGELKTFMRRDGAEHSAGRRPLVPHFTARQAETLRPGIQRIADELTDHLLAGPRPADLVESFALPVSSLVICELLGVPYADRAFFHRTGRSMVSPAVTPAESVAAARELMAYLDDLVARKTAGPGDDLLGRLAAEWLAPGRMTRREIAEMGQLLLIAGYETTANMIALGVVALLEHPAQLARLREDPGLLPGAVEELLRYLSIVHIGRRRTATADLVVGGRRIREGEGMIAATDIADRDESVYSQPDVLDLRRAPRHHLAFGSGPHQCLGQALARVELQVVYGTLLRRVPALALAVPADQLRYKDEMVVYGVHELPVTW